MKKRTLLVVTGLCVLTLFAGCGKEKEPATDTQNTVVESETEKEDTQTIEYAPSYKPEDFVTLGEYKGLALSVEKAEVTEENVKSYVGEMLSYYPAYQETDKSVVEEGDSVNIDYEGLKDGVAFDGGTSAGYVLEIGSNTFIDGFEDGLVGAKVGEKVALNLTFPEDYGNTELAGQDVVFNVTVNSIVIKQDMTYETLTDEYVEQNFSSSYGYTTVQELKDGAKQELESTNEYYAQNNTRAALIDELLKANPVSGTPEAVLEERIKKYKEQFETTCQEQYGQTSEEYLAANNMTKEDFDAEIEAYMSENLELEIILLAVAEKEGITLDAEGFETYLSNMMSSYGYESQDVLYAEYGEEYIKNSYIGNLALEFLQANADITYTLPAETEETVEGTEETPEGTEETVEGTEEMPVEEVVEE